MYFCICWEVILQQGKVYDYWKGSEHVTPNYATLVYGLFWAEGNQDPADSENALNFPLTERKYKFPHL